MIREFPELEYFSAGFIGLPILGIEETFCARASLGWNLSQLQNLSELCLRECDEVNGSWSHYPWPQKLTILQLEDCSNLSIPDAFRLVISSAPGVRQLMLNFSDQGTGTWLGQSNSEFHSTWTSKHTLELPDLIDLVLQNPSGFELLRGFENCSKLRSIKYTNVPCKEWGSIQKLLCHSSWPNLISINLDNPQMYDQTDWEIVQQICNHKGFCERSNIKLSHELDS